ncbi:hypothetical protein DPMN_016183 [Dreissena polymorpha]|uniref:Uncharacterized protein n=1 Tax=Dreissena polymorpha TaxID=45954 RepID=A0A9D4NCF5_DREPO|nr:hypothetical protein DPMN_016183 [Dreissena polymorpha]
MGYNIFIEEKEDYGDFDVNLDHVDNDDVMVMAIMMTEYYGDSDVNLDHVDKDDGMVMAIMMTEDYGDEKHDVLKLIKTNRR